MFEGFVLFGIGLAVYALFHISRQLATLGQAMQAQNNFLNHLTRTVDVLVSAANRAGPAGR